MNYTVIWGRIAETHLAAVWLVAPDQAAVTAAAHRIEVRLATNPLRCGEARESSIHRVDFEYPLGAEFEVIEDDKKVIVQGIWLVRR